ncbi:hypothetical protein MSIBF_A2240008 [groundwater metagenome]|uniref:Tetratricopeptide repeat protein n=1 Tax=groundwater metagenome TaxID=717931 RepID=A0A098E8P2_9ZZZZ
MRNDRKLILEKAEAYLKLANNDLKEAEENKISGNIEKYVLYLSFVVSDFAFAGDLYYIIEEYEKAKECFSKAVEFDIEHIKIKREIGNKDRENCPIIKNLLRSKNKELIDKYKSEIIRVQKKSMENLDLGGVFVNKIIEMLVYLGSPDLAKEYFEKALNSGEELHVGNISECYFWLGEYEKAISLFEETLKIKYGDKAYADNLHLGFIYWTKYKLNKDEENKKNAIKYFENALKACVRDNDFGNACEMQKYINMIKDIEPERLK